MKMLQKNACGDCQSDLANFVDSIGMESMQTEVISTLQGDGYCNQQDWDRDFDCESAMESFLSACIHHLQSYDLPGTRHAWTVLEFVRIAHT